MPGLNQLGKWLCLLNCVLSSAGRSPYGLSITAAWIAGILRGLQHQRRRPHRVAEPADPVLRKALASAHRITARRSPRSRPPSDKPRRVALAVAAQIEQQHVVPSPVKVAAQRRHLQPRAPHAMHQHDQMAVFLSRQLPPAQRQAIGRLNRPRLRVALRRLGSMGNG